MAMIFRLVKPQYYRPAGAFGDDFRYDLAPNIVQWLTDHAVSYGTSWKTFVSGDHTHLGLYLEILDPDHAMLFKLTWI
jgi:hypothetical protein